MFLQEDLSICHATRSTRVQVLLNPLTQLTNQVQGIPCSSENDPHPRDHHGVLGASLLQGPRELCFLLREVPMWPRQPTSFQRQTDQTFLRYTGTSLTRNCLLLGSCSRTLPRALRCFQRKHFVMSEVPLYMQCSATGQCSQRAKCMLCRGCSKLRTHTMPLCAFGWSGTVDAFITRIRGQFPTRQSFTWLSLVDMKIGQLPDGQKLTSGVFKS